MHCYFTFFLLVFGTTAFQCEKEKLPEFVDMIFVLDLHISPYGPERKIGDTLWLAAEIPDTILEFNSNSYYKLENFDFQSVLILHRLTKGLYIAEQPGAIENFNFSNKIGSVNVLTETFAKLNFEYSQSKYNCRIALIPREQGIYFVGFLMPQFLDLSFIDLGATADGRKRTPIYRSLYFTINNGENTNFQLLKENAKLAIDDVPVTGNIYFEQKGSFTFRVIQ